MREYVLELGQPFMQMANLGLQAFNVGLRLSRPLVETSHPLVYLLIHTIGKGFKNFRDALVKVDALGFIVR